MEPILSVKQAQDIDAYFIACEKNTLALMEKAGEALFLKIQAQFPNLNTSFLILAGNGGNGGDAFVLARNLIEHHYQNVIVYQPISTHQSNENQINQQRFLGKIIHSLDQIQSSYDVMVDGLFGIGLNRLLTQEWIQRISFLNQIKAYKIAIDIPSGIHGDHGNAMGAYLFCDICYAIQFKKTGHFLNDGIDSYQQIETVDIGEKNLFEDVIYLKNEQDYGDFFKKRLHNTNKGSYGKCAFISGSKTLPGAALLSSLAYAALKIGTGYATLCMPSSLYEIYALHHPELTYVLFADENGNLSYDEEKLKSILHYEVITIGMGLGVSKEIYQTIQYLLTHYEHTLIIDADGLNTLSQFGVEILKEKKCKVILTPHLKEFSRLSAQPMERVKTESILLAKQFVKDYDVLLILKSAVSLIAFQNEMYINTAGTPALAKAGSGDVLSGILSGIVSMYGYHANSALMATYLLGKAGEKAAQQLSEYSVTATDVIACIPMIIQKLQKDAH